MIGTGELTDCVPVVAPVMATTKSTGTGVRVAVAVVDAMGVMVTTVITWVVLVTPIPAWTAGVPSADTTVIVD